jgi:hypothetical protein
MNNACGCAAESEAEMCARRNRGCGSFTGTDNCGDMQTIDCGGCSGADVCELLGTANTCGCDEPASKWCEDFYGFECGVVADLCGNPIDCGSCSGGATCNVMGRCECPTGETTETSCSDGVDNNCDGLIDCQDATACSVGTNCGTMGRKCQSDGTCS